MNLRAKVNHQQKMRLLKNVDQHQPTLTQTSKKKPKKKADGVVGGDGDGGAARGLCGVGGLELVGAPVVNTLVSSCMQELQACCSMALCNIWGRAIHEDPVAGLIAERVGGGCDVLRNIRDTLDLAAAFPPDGGASRGGGPVFDV